MNAQIEDLATGTALPASAPKPQSASQPSKVWGTLYYVHRARAHEGGGTVPLRGADGTEIGVALSQADWCHAAQEGTVAIKTGRSERIYNHAGWIDRSQVDCRSVFPHLGPGTIDKIERTAFLPLDETAPDGLGSDPRFRLVPYRTVAVDPNRFPLGTVLYIPELEGRRTPIGRHDGYVFAGDTGVGVRGNHLDFFTGREGENPAPAVITSSPSSTFVAYRIADKNVIQRLTDQHLRRYTSKINHGFRKRPLALAG